MHRTLTSCVLFMVSRIAFSPDCMELWAVAEPNRLDRYELFEGQLLQQVRMSCVTVVSKQMYCMYLLMLPNAVQCCSAVCRAG